MSGPEIGLLAVGMLLVCIYLGMHVPVALIFVSFISVAFLKHLDLAASMVAHAANDSLQDYLFGVVPLFVLMGFLVSQSGIGRDTFDVCAWLLRRIRGGLGIATVAANAMFAAVTGISIASAAVFTKVATPEMIRHGYSPKFSVGVVAGSSVLGMLIPPSLLMIVFAVIAEESVGRMFLAGVIPGILLAVGFGIMIFGLAYFRPRALGDLTGQATGASEETARTALVKILPIVVLIGVTLGGLYGGIFTPTEAGAAGALGALFFALFRRALDWDSARTVLREAGHVTASVLLLVLAASLYSRMLALSGLPASIATMLAESNVGYAGFLIAYIVIIILLGCIIDSVSILLIMLPIVLPIAQGMGMDIVWFGVVTVVAVEIGLITPPFGLSVYAVKASLDDEAVSLDDIFAGVLPFIVCMLVVLLIIVLFPGLSTWIAR